MTIMKGLGSEHPRCDSLQNIFLVVYFVMWGLDWIVGSPYSEGLTRIEDHIFDIIESNSDYQQQLLALLI